MLSSVIVKTLLVNALLTFFAFTWSSLQSEKNIFKSGSNSSLSNWGSTVLLNVMMTVQWDYDPYLINKEEEETKFWSDFYQTWNCGYLFSQ